MNKKVRKIVIICSILLGILICFSMYKNVENSPEYDHNDLDLEYYQNYFDVKIPDIEKNIYSINRNGRDMTAYGVYNITTTINDYKEGNIVNKINNNLNNFFDGKIKKQYRLSLKKGKYFEKKIYDSFIQVQIIDKKMAIYVQM